MKFALWCVLCVLCVAAGHVVIGAVALLLLSVCRPVRQEQVRGTERPESGAQRHTSLYR